MCNLNATTRKLCPLMDSCHEKGQTIQRNSRPSDCPLKEVPNETKTNIVVVNKQTNRLLASITDKDIIMANDVEVFNYGNNSPIFTDICGEVYLKPNSFELRIDKENNHDTD